MATTKRESSNSRRLILLLLTTGFFMSGLLFDYMPVIVDNQIKRMVELATNEQIQSLWSRPPVDFHSYYWLYDILNAEKFSAGEEKVRVRRVGPYHFVSRAEKKILDLSANKYRLTYNSTRHIHLDQTQAVSLDEPLVLLNPVYASLVSGAREMLRDQDAQSKQMMFSSLSRMVDKFNETLFINCTARSALVGRRLPIVEKLVKLAETFGFDIELPSIATAKLFGYVSVLNGTWDGPFEMYTGYQASMSSLGDLVSYRGKKRLSDFQGKCNRLQASAGELRPMPIADDQSLEMFQPRFCRILRLTPTGALKLKEGHAIKYELSASDFASAQVNPDNRCFCLNKTLNNYCSLNGALELGPCTYHSPIVVTASNIKPEDRITGSVLNWDPDMLRGDVELVPEADQRGQIVVLKRLGLPLRGDVTLTLFIRLIRDPTFRQTSQVPEESFIPVLTVRERGQVPPKLGQIIVNLESFLSLTTHLKVVMYLTAIVLLCWLTGHYYTKSGILAGGPRVTPSGINGGDGDQTSRQSGKVADRLDSSGGGAGSREKRLSRVALPASGAASDRANSADSNRSQPPSRVSHGSLDAVSNNDELLNGDALGSNRPTTNNEELDEPELLAGPRARAAQSQHRIFSKVDEEANLRSESWRAKRQAKFEARKQTGAANGRPDGSSSAASSSSASKSGRADTSDARGGEAETKPSGKRNWFMKVCSNFVRMLNGIRSSINDAGQLDVSENDYQDKQLEMLAGKIDSWYQSSPVTPDLSSTSGGGGGGTGQALPMSGGEPRPEASREAAEQAPARARSGDELGTTTTTTRRKRDEAEKSHIAAGGGRANRQADQDEAGVGGGDAEENSRRQAPRLESSTNQQQATNASPSSSEAFAAGPKLTPTPQIPASNKADRAPPTNNTGGGVFSSDAKSVAFEEEKTSPAATRISDKNGLFAERVDIEPAFAASRETEQSAPAASRPSADERRDSVQSNETVINKGNRDADPSGGHADYKDATNRSAIAAQQPQQGQPAKMGNATVAGGASAAADASAAREAAANNELGAARDKKAALESVEKALTAAANMIEGC